MMTDDLPADLVERCARAAARANGFDPDYWTRETKAQHFQVAEAVLREAGVAEMAAALEPFAEQGGDSVAEQQFINTGWIIGKTILAARAALSRYRKGGK